MRSIVNYFRQVFCKHEWEREECKTEWRDGLGSHKKGLKVSATCVKCCYHKSYWKF
jgi:hypothetical protein